MRQKNDIQLGKMEKKKRNIEQKNVFSINHYFEFTLVFCFSRIRYIHAQINVNLCTYTGYNYYHTH